MARLSRSCAVIFLLPLALVGCGAQSVREAGDPTAPAVPIDLDTPLVPAVIVKGEPPASASERALQQRMAGLGVPGVSIAVIRDREISWAEGFGLADVASGRPVTPRTLFQAASISKPVAAMGALRLVQDGVVGLDDDVNPHLSSWKVPNNAFTHPENGRPRPVTLRSLLSHTAGLTVHGFPGYARDVPIPTAIEVLDGKGNTDPIRVDTPPGGARRYSGGGYTVAQQLMVDAAGGEKSFAELMKETVLEPLAMTDSTYEQPLPDVLHSRAATGYRGDGTPVEGLWHVYPEMAAAGLWTTPTDLARFLIAVQRGAAGEDGPVLGAAMVAEMLAAPVEDGYGLGLVLGEDRFGHGGSNQGFRCTMTAFYEGGNGAVVMTNSDSGSALANEVLLTLFATHEWPGMEPVEKVVIGMSRDRLERFAGTFRIEGYGDVAVMVAEQGDRLRFVFPDGVTDELRPESETVFFDPDDGQSIEFLVDDESRAVTGFSASGFQAVKVES